MTAGQGEQAPLRAAPTVSLARQGVAVPGWALRAAVAVAGGGLAAVLVSLGAPDVLIVIVGLLVALSALSPASAAPAAAIGATVLGLVVVSPADPVTGLPVYGCVVAAHVLHVAAGLAGAIPVDAHVHLRALRRPALRFAAIQLVVGGLAAVAWLLPARQNPVLLEITAAVVVAALAAVPVVLLLRRR